MSSQATCRTSSFLLSFTSMRNYTTTAEWSSLSPMKKLASVRQLTHFMPELIGLYEKLHLILLSILEKFNDPLKVNYSYLPTGDTTSSYQLAKKKALAEW